MSDVTPEPTPLDPTLPAEEDTPAEDTSDQATEAAPEDEAGDAPAEDPEATDAQAHVAARDLPEAENAQGALGDRGPAE